MHSLMYSVKNEGIYEEFKSCSSRLTMPMYVKDTFPICCRSITRALTQDDEDILTLSVLAWTAPANKRTHLMIFDLNQWYKEEMPGIGDWRMKLKYVSVFELSNCTALDAIVSETSVFPFNSIMRPEEHFYPNSLSFDVCLLENDKFAHMRWYGIQNIVLQQFNVICPQIILEPSYYFNELIQVAILPQFSDVLYNLATPLELKREFLLSVALEYNFNGFLKKCAWAWADGSYLGKDDLVGVGLSTLTDWIWNRVQAIKDVCNVLCKPLFDFSEQRIDYGTQKQLSQCCKQLKVLSELLILVIRDYKQFIPEVILLQLKMQSEEMKMASEYQEVLQWLLNVGLLPEGNFYPGQSIHDVDDDFLIVPYPHQVIKSYYESQRENLADEWLGESKYLFIDAFIEQNCDVGKLKEIWGGSYPPRSIQALLRTLLIPEISIASKHVIFVYLFMDITNVLKDGAYSSIVRNLIKFPAVFKMNPAMIKRTQAFWNLDNGNLETAVEELISPLSHDKHIPLWQRELLITVLLKQNGSSLALRSLRCPGNQISPELEVFTLLANNLISEALKVQRASGDRKLLVKLFEKILHSTSYEQLLDLSLTEEEGNVLREYLQNLKDTGLPNHLNIHFVFLLQRSKFLDAAQLVESMNETEMNLEPPKQVLNAYYATMESTTRKLTSMVYEDEVQVKESPLPLSVNLIQARYNTKNNIYQKCVQSINEAAYDSSLHNQSQPFIGSPKLGIFEYRQTPLNLHDVSYALEVNEHGKRKQRNKVEDFVRLEDLQAPQQKKRKLNEIATVKRKSYMDTRLNNLTVFKETKANFSFTGKSPSSSMRTTPDRVHTFGNFRNFLATPVIEKKTPPQKIFPQTPHSILKTRSRCGSISPAPSRFSEVGDDNKSVKSITFAALPDSRDTSLNDSSMLEENFNEEEKLESSAENFYSPGKSPEKVLGFLDGPKARKPIKSRSSSPAGEKADQSQELNVSANSEASRDLAKPFRDRSVLKDNSSCESDEASCSSTPDKSIYNYVRRSVLPVNFGELSDSEEEVKVRNDEKSDERNQQSFPERQEQNSKEKCEENSRDKNEKIDENSEESVADEHFEEEELPEHSDYSDSSEENNEIEYEEVESDESSSQESAKPKSKMIVDDVICLDSSDDDVQEHLPSFGNLAKIQENDDNSMEIVENPVKESSHAEILSTVYRNLDVDEKMEIESPAHEQLSPMKQQQQLMLTRAEIEAGPSKFDSLYETQNQSKNVEVFEAPEAVQEEIVMESEVDYVEGPKQSQNSEDLVEKHQEIHLKSPEKVIQNTPEIQKSAETQNLMNIHQKTLEIEQIIPETQQAIIVNPSDDCFKSPADLNESEISEECSFVSAAGELNEAVVMSEVEETAVDEEQFEVLSSIFKEFSSEISTTSVEVTNILDQALNQSEISMETAKDEDPSTSQEVSKESSGFSEDLTPREVRARSVPSSGTSSPRSRSTRASTEDREKPKNRRKPKVLEIIEEKESPIPSPGPLTRRRSQLLLTEENENTPQTPTRMTRRRSMLADEAPTTPTTRRMTRAASNNSLATSEPEKTPEDPAVLTRQRSLRIRTTSASSADDAKSTRSTRSTKKTLETPTSSAEKQSPVEVTSLTNRRLTRKQMQVLEKSQIGRASCRERVLLMV